MASLAGATGKVASRFEDTGVVVVALAKLGMFVAIVGVLAVGVELFTAGVGALFLLRGLEMNVCRPALAAR